MSIFRVTLAGLIAASSALICLASLVAFLGQYGWVFELATHFRVQYLLGLCITGPLLVVWRRYYWAATVLIVALINVVVLAPRFLTPTTTTPINIHPTTRVRVLLANVNSANRDYQRIRQTIIRYNPDIVVLLETTPWLVEQLQDLHEPYPYRAIAAREDNFGIAVLSRYPFVHANTIEFSAAQLPSISAEFTQGPHPFTVLGTHPLPPMGAALAQDRNQQLANLATFARHAAQPLLLVGDLNCSPWSPYFKQLLTESGLRDSADGRGILPSWPVGWPPLWIPIDHALFSTGIQIHHRETGPDLGSDHYPVIVDFQVIGS
jgi:endonuclease/exonuclease/phosphatase (EEP) superfamily protein YafD